MNKFLVLFNYQLKRFYKNPLQIFFGLLFPILWMVISGTIWKDQVINGVAYINYMFAPIVLLMMLTLTIINFPLNLGYHRGNRVLKQFALLGIKKHQYLLIALLFNYLFFCLMFLILVIIGILGFALLSGITMFYLFLGASIIFVALFCVGILIGSCGHSFSAILSLSLILLYLMLFTSGIMIPAYLAGSWFSYLQKITPAGNGVLLLQQLFLSQPIKSDLFPLLYSILFTLFIIPSAIYYFKFV